VKRQIRIRTKGSRLIEGARIRKSFVHEALALITAMALFIASG